MRAAALYFPMVELIVTRHAHAQGFLDRARDWLMAAEVENNLIFGVCDRLIADPGRYGGDPYLVAVERSGEIVTVALMTPPYRVVLATSSEPGGASAIAEDLLEGEHTVPGAFGPPGQVAEFARSWCQLTSAEVRVEHGSGIYELREVRHPNYTPGCLRLAAEDEIELLTAWRQAFIADVGAMPETPEQSRRITQRLIAASALFIWDDGGPVSQATSERSTPRGRSVGGVYTPPELRNRGYATSCVAALSQRLLDSGSAFCCLFTDLGNPTSNAIYQRIGYRQVAEWHNVSFG